VSAIVEEQATPAIESPTRSFRWRLFPAAFLMIFGLLEVLLIVVVLAVLMLEPTLDLKLFHGPNSPELTPKSLRGMACLVALGLTWFSAGWMIWRKKYLAGLLVAVLSYPIGALGANSMFSSSVKQPAMEPNSVPPPMQQPRFDDGRRRRPPMPLARADIPKSDDRVLR
jgi:hypothetical protein